MSGRGPAGGTGTAPRWTVKATVRVDACPGEAARVQAAWIMGECVLGKFKERPPKSGSTALAEPARLLSDRKEPSGPDGRKFCAGVRTPGPGCSPNEPRGPGRASPHPSLRLSPSEWG